MEDLLESYFSKDDIELNLDKFPKETKILYVTGLSGSGKSTIAEDIAKRVKNIINIQLDIFFYISKHTKEFIINDLKTDPLSDNSEFNIFFVNYVKKMPESDFNFSKTGEFTKDKTQHVANMAFDFIKELERKKDQLHKYYVVEGIQIFLSDPKFFRDKPLIILGTGLFKSNFRGISREFHNKDVTFGDKLTEILYRVFGLFGGALKYDDKELNKFRLSLTEDTVDSATEKRSMKTGVKAAVDAVIASRLRHKADNDFKAVREVPVKIKLKRLRDELAKEKINNLIKLVVASETTNDRISVEIRDDKGNTRQVIADFDGVTHMGLHTLKNQHNILDQDRSGRKKDTQYGENDKFIKKVTGKDLPELLDKKYESLKRKYNIVLEESEETGETYMVMKEESKFSGTKNVEATKYLQDKMKSGKSVEEVIETDEWKDLIKRTATESANKESKLNESEFYDDLMAMYGDDFSLDTVNENMPFEFIEVLTEGRKLEYYKYIREHTNNVKKAYRWMKKHIPEIFLNFKSKVKTDLTIMKHDLSKYTRKEFSAYSKHFHGTPEEKEKSLMSFKNAWNHHQKVNKHHWQYWVLVDGSGKTTALDMPFENIVEMIADWWSFSWKKGQLDEIFSWYAANRPKMILSAKTESTVNMILSKIKSKLRKLKEEERLEESYNEFSVLDEELSDPFEDIEEDFYDDFPMDYETYLFCEDCEKMLANSLNEDTKITKEQREYSDYLTQHVTNVKRGYFWIKENAPEILDGCDKEKVESNLIVHDESKYSNEEYDAYSKFFYGERTAKVRRDFRAACMHHFMNNPHHPEWWMGMDMSQEALVEALCDWWSFSWKENNMNDIFDFWKKARKHKFGQDMTQNSKDRMQVLIEKLYNALDRANMF